MDEGAVVRASVISGLFSALAAVTGKIGVTNERCQAWVQNLVEPGEKIWVLAGMIQGLGLAAMVLSNSIMWAQFSWALAHSPNTIQVTSINTGANFLFTALFGWLFFSEPITAGWTVGIGCIMTGIALLRRQTGMRPNHRIPKD